jgi:hypothetical protein
LSRNGVKVDGRVVGEGEIIPVHVGTVVEIGAEAKISVDDMPEVGNDGAGAKYSDWGAEDDAVSTGTDFFDAGMEQTESAVATSDAPAADIEVTSADAENEDDVETHGDFEDALTEAGDGETQEMKTRVGSMEEIYARKRQLDRASAVKKWRFGALLTVVMLALAGIWFVTGSHRHVTDAEGPFLPSGEPDLASWDVRNSDGDIEMYLEFPRDDRMKITPSDDSNSVDVVTFLGIDRDVPFHVEFKKWIDSEDLKNSLLDSFEKRVREDSGAGMTFERQKEGRFRTEFFDTVFPGYCEQKSQRGVRFVRAEFTRAVNNELWHGVVLYLRHGDTIYQLRTEIPDMYWKRGGYRLTDEPHLGIYRRFSESQWDSPGYFGIVSEEYSDDYLIQCVKRELSAERISSWPMVESYIDTLLVRTWSEKPVTRRITFAHYKIFLERLQRFYNERHLAFKVARENGDEKRMRAVFTDVKTVFGVMARDRRSSLVYDPEVWACHQDR